MRELDLLRNQQLEETLRPFRRLTGVVPPVKGWVRAIREALGMTNVQLAARLRKKPQTIEDMQRSEELGTIKLSTLRELAEAMGCRVVYALVPEKGFEELQRDQATRIARRLLGRTAHSMKLEAQGLSVVEEERALERQVDRLMRGSPKKLWD